MHENTTDTASSSFLNATISQAILCWSWRLRFINYILWIHKLCSSDHVLQTPFQGWMMAIVSTIFCALTAKVFGTNTLNCKYCRSLRSFSIENVNFIYRSWHFSVALQGFTLRYGCKNFGLLQLWWFPCIVYWSNCLLWIPWCHASVIFTNLSPLLSGRL